MTPPNGVQVTKRTVRIVESLRDRNGVWEVAVDLSEQAPVDASTSCACCRNFDSILSRACVDYTAWRVMSAYCVGAVRITMLETIVDSFEVIDGKLYTLDGLLIVNATAEDFKVSL